MKMLDIYKNKDHDMSHEKDMVNSRAKSRFRGAS